MDRRASQAILPTFIAFSTLAAALTGCKGDGVLSGSGQQKASQPPVVATGGAAPRTSTAGVAVPGQGPMPNTSLAVMPAPGQTAADMPAEVVTILRARCSGCHTYGQADPAGWGSVLDLSRMIEADIVVPGKPEESRLIDRVAVAGNMPPQGPPLDAADVVLLKKWITDLGRKANNTLNDDDVLDLIASDQLALRDRSNDYRYVSFAHYAGQGRPEGELAKLRQVFTFVLNSLSRRGALVDMPTIDAGKSVFRIQLSELGWNAALWDTLTSFYPYCLTSDAAPHQALYVQLGTEAPVVRGDWFLATATKAPLYDLLTDLPGSVDELALKLGVNINNDINHPGLAEPDNLVRVGFRRSGVALHNRLLERHLGTQGQYLWISYDFAANDGTSDLMANPLGPKLRDQQNFVHTFENAGGEVIFTMPNGLQGYMVVNAVGKKLDAVPLNVARDPNRRDAVVQNGLSCFGCHGASGTLRPRDLDEVPRYSDTHIAQFLGKELNEIASSYPRVLRPDAFAVDGARYRAIAETAPGGAPPSDGVYYEYVTALGQYESSLGFHGAAEEFSEEFSSFKEKVLANDFQNIALPRNNSAPLVLRDDFVCLFRDLVTKIRANAVFCAKTFDAAAVANLCGSSRTSPGSGSSTPPVVVSPPPRPRNTSSPDAGTSSSTGNGSDAGAPLSDASSGKCRWVRVDGRWVCQ